MSSSLTHTQDSQSDLECATVEGLIKPIFRIPHVVISFRQAVFSMVWLEALKNHTRAHNQAGQSYRLKKVDIVCSLYNISMYVSVNKHVLNLRAMGDLLNSFVQESMVVRSFIVTEADPPGCYNDGTGPIIYDPLGTMRKIKQMMVFGDKLDTCG